MSRSIVSGEETPSRPRPTTSSIERSDLVIAVVLTVTFTAAFINAWRWESIAAYFPLIATGLGILLCSLFIVRNVVLVRNRRRLEAGNATDAAVDRGDSDHAFFASVPLADWLVSLTFFVAFFAALYVFGLYATSVVFTVIYLRFQAKSSWMFSVLYAAVLTASLYALFEMALKLPVPAGLVGLQ